MRGDRRTAERERDGEVLKGLAVGLVAGLVASWTMNLFQAMWSKQEVGVEKPHGAQGIKPYAEGQESRQAIEKAPEDKVKQDDDPTEKVAEAITESVFD
nr:hypothetical protein [Acidobacteriota bacterium]